VSNTIGAARFACWNVLAAGTPRPAAHLKYAGHFMASSRQKTGSRQQWGQAVTMNIGDSVERQFDPAMG
jgi:hypothetical protein